MAVKVAREEVGAGNVYQFPIDDVVSQKTLYVPTKNGTKEEDLLGYPVIGDSMESPDPEKHIGNGWVATCRLKFEKDEIFLFPCLVRLFGRELTLRWVSVTDDNQIVLTPNNPRYQIASYAPESVEILGVNEYSTRFNKK